MPQLIAFYKPGETQGVDNQEVAKELMAAINLGEDVPVPDGFEICQEQEGKLVNIRTGEIDGEFLTPMLTKWLWELSAWSQETFGNDEERGPIGALKHLRKEIDEIIEAPDDRWEYADAFTLIVDAARRAGVPFIMLLNTAIQKLEINKQRDWPKPNPDDPTEPVEHVRNDDLEKY